MIAPPGLRDRMRTILKHASCSLVLLALTAAAPARDASSGKTQVYKWVDEKGEVHYGDSVPPQYTDQDKTLLNAQGVPFATIPGRRSPEQMQTEAARRAAEDRVRDRANLSRRRDQNLLATYLTVEEIESLRNRRADILDGQARVTGQYLEQLHAKQRQLEEQARHFQPYSTAASTQRLPERIAEDLVHVTLEIAAQQRNLEIKRQDSENLKAQFASDIARFRELKKIESDYARGTPAARD